MEERKMSKTSISSLAKSVSSKKGLTVAEAERFITKMFEVAKEGIQEDKQLKVRWLGTFKVTTVKERESVDVNTGDRILIEGRDKISFTPDNILKEIVNKPFAQFETVVVNDGVDFSDIDEKFARMENGLDEEELSQPSMEQTEISAEATIPNSDTDAAVDEATTESSIDEATTTIESSVEVPRSEVADDLETTVKSEATVESEATETTEGVMVDSELTVSELANPESSVMSESADPESSVESEPAKPKPDESPASELPTTSNRHFVVPKYLVAIVAVVFVLLMGATFWFAFNYGKMQAQRDSLESQLNVVKMQAKAKPVATHQPVAKKVEVDSVQLAMREKARQDSIRMVQSSNAVKIAEEAEKKDQQETNPKETSKPTNPSDSQLRFNDDVRVRTGAYRIVGVDKTITVKAGQTMTSLSKRYLGDGMECYIEALNGCKVVKEGQKIKIPKLALKKK